MTRGSASRTNRSLRRWSDRLALGIHVKHTLHAMTLNMNSKDSATSAACYVLLTADASGYQQSAIDTGR